MGVHCQIAMPAVTAQHLRWKLKPKIYHKYDGYKGIRYQTADVKQTKHKRVA